MKISHRINIFSESFMRVIGFKREPNIDPCVHEFRRDDRSVRERVKAGDLTDAEAAMAFALESAGPWKFVGNGSSMRIELDSRK